MVMNPETCVKMVISVPDWSNSFHPFDSSHHMRSFGRSPLDIIIDTVSYMNICGGEGVSGDGYDTSSFLSDYGAGKQSRSLMSAVKVHFVCVLQVRYTCLMWCSLRSLSVHLVHVSVYNEVTGVEHGSDYNLNKVITWH